MAELSDDAFFAPAQSGNNAPASKPPRTLNDSTFFMEGDPLSPENVRPSLKEVLFHNDPLGEMAKGLKKGVGMAGQLADMALGLPGQAIRVGANVGGRLSALTQGGSAEDAAWAGKAMADQVPRSLTNPVGAAMEAFGYGKDYNENQVAHVLESVMGVVSKGGEWVEEKTGKVLLKRDVEDLFETFMFSLGTRGTAVGLDPRLKKLAPPEVGDIPRDAGNLERYRGRPPKGGWRRPLEEPTLGEEPIPQPEVRATPDSRGDSFTNRPAGGPDVWQTPRARQPVGEATDLSGGQKLPVGEATEVPNIPTGEAFELPADGIPVGEARYISGAVGRKIADKMRQGAVPAAVAGTGLGLAIAYPEDSKEIAAAAAGGVLVGKGKSRGMEYLKNIPDSAPLGAVLEPSATTLLTLERLDPKRFEFSKGMIEQELRRPDVTKAEKETFRWALDNISGDSVTAKQLVTMLKMKTGDWELARVETDRWANYGLEAIARLPDPESEVDTGGPPATTTLYNLPEELGVRSGNHFGVPNNFAHTRSFIEDDIRHVVEIQSDLVQKMRMLEEGEKTKLQTELAKVAREIIEARNYNRAILMEDGSGYRPGYSAADRRLLQPLQLREAEIQAALRASEQATHNRSLIEPLIKDWYKRIVREELARGEQEKATAAARMKDFESLSSHIPPDHMSYARPQIEYQVAEKYRLDGFDSRRAQAVVDRPPVVRFATADTVAKVEGWTRAADARDVASARRMVEAAEANVAEVERSGQGPVFRPSPEHARALARAEKELAGFRERLADYEEQLASGRQFARKEHQSIYDRYRGDVEKFLRRLGGKPHTDSAGHTWIEVPTSGSKEVPAGKRVQLLSAVLAAGGLTAYLATHPEREDDLIAAGILTGAVVKGKPGVDMKRVTALLGQKLYGDLSKMPVVAAKELVQNAFDAIKTQLVKKEITEGKMAIGLNSAERSITVADNGSGMTPEVLGKQFLTVAGTLKGSGRDSGGLGIAKLQFLFGSKAAEVYTLKDGKLSVLNTTGERLSAAMMEGGEQPDIHVFEGAEARRLFEEKYKEAHQLASREAPPRTPDSGTVVKIVVPDDFTDTSTGAQKAIEFPVYSGDLPVLKSPLFENIDVKVGKNGSSIYHSMGKDFDAAAHSHLFSVQFPWGKARIYATKDPVTSYSNNMNFLSNGLYQFENKLAKDPKNNWSDPVPRTFYIDVEPAVRAEDPGYPFDLHRQGFTQSAAKDFQLVQNYLNKLYEKDSLGDSASTMADVEYMDWVGRRTKVQGLDAAPLEEGMSHHIAGQDKVEVRDGKLIVNGRAIPLLTPEEMSKARLEAQNYKVPEGTLDVSRPVLHDNMLVPKEVIAALAEAEPYKGSSWRFEQRAKGLMSGPLVKFTDYARSVHGEAFDRMNSQIGHLFKELRDRLVEVYKDDPSISAKFADDLKKFGVGVGYDTTYRGVSAKLPVNLMLVNPAAIVRMAKNDPGSNPLRASAALYGTMIHEITHVVHRGHGEASFIPAMAQLMADLASDPRVTAIRTKLRDVLTQHEAMLLDLNEVMTNVRQSKLAKAAGRNLSNESDFEGVGGGPARESSRTREGGPGTGGSARGLGEGAGGPPGVTDNGGIPTGPRGSQAGAVDPKLATALVAIGAGSALAAWLSPRENRTKNAGLAGAVIGLAAFMKGRSPIVADWVSQVGRGAEYIAGVISTTIREASPALLKRMRDHERWVLTNTNERLNAIGPFITALRKLPEAVGARLSSALLTGDAAAIREAIIAAGDRTVQVEYAKVRTLLNQMGRELHATGRLRQLVITATEEYYPRIVTDVKGLLNALGQEERSLLQRMIDSAQSRAARRTGMPLTDLEVSFVINEFLKSRTTGQGRSGFLKRRSVGEITPELAPFYAPASESLSIYIRAMTKEIERARFFGEELVRDGETGVTNLEQSIGNVVEKERRLNGLPDEKVETLRAILQSRFGSGEAAGAGLLQAARNLTNVGLLGNITSSVTQLGDLALSTAAHGLVPTARALARLVTRNPQRASVRDIGLVDHITEEITGGMRTPLIVMGREFSTAKFVEKTFKFTGFSLVDQLGKAVSINASLLKNRKLAGTAAGVQRLREKYGRAFGEEFETLVGDLRRGEMTESVRSLLFSELSDIQPISKLEVPKAYLDNPNGRILYQMKTFMIKQMDILRREAIGEMRKGNVSKGVGNLVRYGLALGIGGATSGFIVNWMLGKKAELDWGDIPENALKTMGWSNWVIDRARKGEPISAIAGTVAPPWKMWDRLISMDPAAVQYLPPLGKILYYQEMGGAEKADAVEEKRERLEGMSDLEYNRMLRRREERKRARGF